MSLAMINSNTTPRRTDSVLIVSPYAAHPGHYWNNAEKIALALQKEGRRIAILIHDTTVRAPAPKIAGSIKSSPRWWQRIVRAVLFGLGKFPTVQDLRRPLETLGVLITVSQTARKNRDSTIVHCIDATFLIFFVWEFFARRQCVYNVMGSAESLEPTRFLPNPFRWLKWILTRWFLAASLRRGLLEFCAETEAVRRDWAKIVGAHVHVIPYAISLLTHPIPQARARADLGLKQDETVLLLFGTQRADKDFATVIRAARQLSPHPFLLFVGKHLSGPAPSTLLRKLGFTNYQVCDRFVSEEEAMLYFAACDAVLLPYDEGYEKGSGVLVEACQHVRPVIATDSGHLREFAQRHHIGWLFRHGDPDDLARCMRAVTSTTLDERTALQERIFAAASHYSWARIIREYLALYAKVAKKNDMQR